MTSLTPDHIRSAAQVAHRAVSVSLKSSLGRAPLSQEVAHALGHAYGTAKGQFATSGGKLHQMDALDRISFRAFLALAVEKDMGPMLDD